MASLDRLEGDALEGVFLALLAVLVFLGYGLWKAGKALSLSNLIAALKAMLNGGGFDLSGSPVPGPFGPFDVVTGTNYGVQADGSIGPGPDYFEPEPLQTLNDLPAYPLGG